MTTVSCRQRQGEFMNKSEKGRAKKPTTRRGGAKRKQWEQEALNSSVKEGSISFMLDEQGNVYPISAEDHVKAIERVKAAGDETKFLTKLGQVRRANKHLDKRAADAMNHLLLWAKATGQCEYYEKLSPDDQWELLEVFSNNVSAGIKRAKFEKRRYDTIDQAYLWVESKMIRFRKKHGIPNNESLSEKLSKEFYAPIRRFKRWRKYVEQHDNNEKALQRGILRRWHERYGRIASKKKLGALRAHSNAP
jgi:hypothetical protein